MHKSATQSSNRHPDKWLAGAAVDGNGNQMVSGNSCALTSDDFKNTVWWTVDLGRVYAISEVKIYHRYEGKCKNKNTDNKIHFINCQEK